MKIFKYFLLYIFICQSFFSQELVHKTYTIRDGIVSNEVRSIFTDSKGYVWFATNDGISRWDGKNFFNLSVLEGLTTPVVFDITEDADRTIYFAQFGANGITTFKDGIIDTLFNSQPNNLDFVSIIQSTPDNALVIAASQGIFLYKNNVLVNLNDLSGIPLTSVYDKYVSEKGEIYFATSDGVLKYEKGQLTQIIDKSNLEDLFTTAISGNSDGELFFGGKGKIYIYHNNEVKPFTLLAKFLTNEIFDIHFSKNGTGYFATDVGLFVLENNNIKKINTENGLLSNRIWNIFEHPNGEIFITDAESGFQIYKPNLIENYHYSINKDYDNIFNFIKTSNGTEIINSFSGLILKNTTKKLVFDINKYPYFKLPLALLERKNGDIIVGSRSGIHKLEETNLHDYVKFKGTLDVHTAESNNVFDIAETSDSTLLVGTYKGVYKIKNEAISKITKEDGLSSNYIQSILVTKDNLIIYGSHNNGIDIYQNGQFTNYSKSNGLTDNSISDLFESENGSILIGTENVGLNIFRNGLIDTITVTDGLLSNKIRAVAEDKLGNIIVTTPKGINIISLREGELFIRSITEQDGLAGNDCNPNALFIDSENSVYIGTNNGLTKYRPNFESPITIPPRTYLTGLEIYNNPISLETFKLNPQLNYDENYLKLHFVGINISAPHKTIYRYRLSGIDKDWVTSKNTSVQYTSLDDGDYTFEVKAKNEWGYWSEPAHLSFIITPAWWETWWFYTLATLSIAALIAFVASYRYRHLLAIEKVRTKISTDLHDSIGSGLTEISFLSEMVKSQTMENIMASKGLNNISDISKTLINDMRDIVWLVNPKNDTLKDLFLRLQDSYQEVLRFSNINLRIHGIEKLTKFKLPMNYRQHIYLMFKEAINNSIKYSGCKNITVSVVTTSNNLEVKLEDDGKGFNLEKVKYGNGLKNIKFRAEQVRGNIYIDSEETRGTNIKFVGKFSKLNIMEI
jgi:ligand-binding sensor domain-containing protein